MANDEEKICDIARYNKKVIGKHISVYHGVGSHEKKQYAGLCSFAIMCQRGYANNISNQIGDNSLKSIMNYMFSNSELLIDKTFLKDDRKES